MSNPQKTEAIQYLESHVNVILKPLMVELLKKRPEKVCDFIVNWTKKEGKDIEKNRNER